MTRKKRTYSLRLIRENYSYSIDQIADLFGIDIATVRRWIRKDGLKRLPQTRPHLVHSSDLRYFLEQRQKASKFPCAEDEMFCFNCRLPQRPERDSGSITIQDSGLVIYKAKCGCCGTKVNRKISKRDWSQNHLLAAYLKGAPTNTNESHLSPRECPLQEKGQLHLKLQPKIKVKEP